VSGRVLRGAVAGDGHERGDGVLEALGRAVRLLAAAQVGIPLREVVAVAGEAPKTERALTGIEGLELPAEQRSVEGLGAVGSRVLSSLKFHVPGWLTNWAPWCSCACHTQNATPSGSASMAMRPASRTSNGSTSTRPPASFAFAAASSALSTQT
jgi:hypothetical protein